MIAQNDALCYTSLFMQVEVYNFSSASSYLKHLYQARQKQSPKLSLRGWCRRLGLSHPTQLKRILEGETALSPTVAKALIKTNYLTASQAHYLLFVAENLNAIDIDINRRKEIFETFCQFESEKHSELPLLEFETIAQWYSIPLLELLSTKDFKPDISFICSKFIEELNPQTVKVMIERLFRLGLLSKTKDGQWVRNINGRLTAGNKGLNLAVQNFHRQMIMQALKSMTSNEVNVEERDFSATSVCIPRENFIRLKKLVSEFNRKVGALSVTKSGDRVYQVNVQVFPLTRGQ
jgi:uncharacterized protein (TIGR02147 family)